MTESSVTSQISHKHQPSLKQCPPPSSAFTGRRDILTKMHAYFSSDIGKRHIFVLHGLGGVGKSEISRKFIEESQVGVKPSRCVESFYKYILHWVRPSEDFLMCILLTLPQRKLPPQILETSLLSMERVILQRTPFSGYLGRTKNGFLSSIMQTISHSIFEITSLPALSETSSSRAETAKPVSILPIRNQIRSFLVLHPTTQTICYLRSREWRMNWMVRLGYWPRSS